MRLIRLLGIGMAGALVLGTALAQDIKFFRIGTGGTARTECPVGGLTTPGLTSTLIGIALVAPIVLCHVLALRDAAPTAAA
jgi:hypothetical protein